MKPAADYTKLDEAILARIKAHEPATTAVVVSPVGDVVAVACEVMPASASVLPVWRLVDRRLQNLRKAGKIEFKNGGWMVKHEQP